MLIHQGWLTALYTLHLLDSQSYEFEICILQTLNMPLINTLHQRIFPKEAIPSHYFPLREDILAPSLGLGTTWVRQLRSGSCHYPTAATKCNEQPSQATATALAICETSQVLLAGVSGGFSRGSPVFAPPTDWPVSYELK